MSVIQRVGIWLRENDLKIFRISSMLYAASMIPLICLHLMLEKPEVLDVVSPYKDKIFSKVLYMLPVLGGYLFCGIMSYSNSIREYFRFLHRATCVMVLIWVIVHTAILNVPFSRFILYPPKSVDQISTSLNSTLGLPPAVFTRKARAFWSKFPNQHQCCGVNSSKDWDNSINGSYRKHCCGSDFPGTDIDGCFERGCLASAVKEYRRLNTPYIQYKMYHLMIMIVSMGWLLINVHASNHFTLDEWIITGIWLRSTCKRMWKTFTEVSLRRYQWMS